MFGEIEALRAVDWGYCLCNVQLSGNADAHMLFVGLFFDSDRLGKLL